MTNHPSGIRAAVCGLVLAGSVTATLAQSTWANPKTFDTGIGSWIVWNGWGIQDPFLSFDPYMDAAGDPNSGSLRYDVPFTGAAGEQFMTFGTFSDKWGWDGGVVVNTIGNYKAMYLDIKIDPSTAPTKNNDYGPLELGLTTDGWGQVYLTNWTIPATISGWNHIVVPIDPSKAGVEKANGFFIKMWSDGAYTNTMSFNVDNIGLQPMTNEPPPAPPTLSLAPAQPGLNLIAAGTGPWDRQNIRTLNPEYSWVGKGSTPVSYSFTVASYPGTNAAGFELHTYFVPATDASGTVNTSSSPDWDQPNVIFMDLQNQADGSATWTFRWKTNTPGSNGTFFDGTLNATVTEPGGALGTWTVTFVNDTQVTLTTPSGKTANYTFTADDIAYFRASGGNALPLYFYIGAKPNDHASNYAQRAVVSRLQLQGLSNPIDASFTAASGLDTNVWEIVANNGASGVVVAPADAFMWVKWTMPDLGFVLQSNPVLANTGWTDLSVSPGTTSKGKEVLISGINEPGQSQGYFRLVKRPFAKLQVLLPGEASAPGTATGKTGTPNPQNVGVEFTITVNAVDETYRVVAIAPSDEIAITSTDDTAALPANATLVAGTATFKVTSNKEGSFTLTASDVTDATKTAGTSASVTVNP